MFRNLYAEVDGTKVDILDNGGKSCALFVSAILFLQKMISDVHSTVTGTQNDLIKSGWKEIEAPRPGAVLVWEKKLAPDGIAHAHIGFFMGNDEAISNDSNGTGFIIKHHYTYEGTRKIEKIYWHPELE